MNSCKCGNLFELKKFLLDERHVGTAKKDFEFFYFKFKHQKAMTPTLAKMVFSLNRFVGLF